ncbi:hypothetical protein QYE76_005980 [Lolium multiflorum]|uniref:Uncharacterized protein n=1 Tax=Lolium multiflorum TaxID=4521 RepID=A0AAD8W1A5_LOLMU|nr:hypothetical protein QYE76_005980 [Lolium multiflorum]
MGGLARMLRQEHRLVKYFHLAQTVHVRRGGGLVFLLLPPSSLPTPSEEQAPPARVFSEADFVDNKEAEAATLKELRRVSAREAAEAKLQEEEDVHWTVY